ncbi:MAG: Luciferase-like, subgroup [Candidatus Binatus sp.]|jgi:alkanesulfonate monooxygenase SsuD/methylene tetrahydromethanopterin reductase-like flavin-dependent oxidoreductase (luciferase family)|nr:Luciferase-like, subgroup [Candidatus Binatus sp.]
MPEHVWHLSSMRYAFDTPQFGPYANPRLLAELAHEAEEAGWDAYFIWDHIQVGWPDPVADPWIALAAMAMTTKRILLGPMVTPLFRRHPWKVAREAVTLDHLSGGRVVLGVGSGGDIFGEIRAFDGPTDDKVRAEMLDESLAILLGLWSGEKFSFKGKHYTVRETEFLPTPIQKPRVPIWVAGTWPRKPPFRRAARFDGVVPVSGDIEKALTPDQFRELIAYVRAHRSTSAPFDVVVSGDTFAIDREQDRAIVAPYQEAGATWWFESPLPWKTPLDRVRARIRKGPPK